MSASCATLLNYVYLHAIVLGMVSVGCGRNWCYTLQIHALHESSKYKVKRLIHLKLTCGGVSTYLELEVGVKNTPLEQPAALLASRDGLE